MDVSNITKYFYLYEYLSDSKKPIEEIKNYLESELSMSAPSVSRTIKSLKQSEIEMIASKDGMYFVDEDAAKEFFIYLKKIFPVSEEDVLVKTLKKMKVEDDGLRSENEILRKSLLQAKTDIKELKSANKELKEDKEKLLVSAPVVFMDSVEIGPEEKFKERELLLDYVPILDIDSCVAKHKKKSFYEIPKQELSEESYRKKQLGGIDFRKMFTQRKKEIEKRNLVEEVGYAGDREVVQTQIIRNRYVAIQKILDDKRLTNQQKLSLYAYYSEFHGSDFESLINFVADTNIDANSFIELMETSTKNEDLGNIKMLLRVLAKPSEVKQRLAFAKELLVGEWYVTADMGEKKMRFVLVPEIEIEMIKEKLGIKQEIEEKKEELMQEKKIKDAIAEPMEMIQTPSFVHTYRMDDGIEPDDYELEGEAVSIDDISGDEK